MSLDNIEIRNLLKDDVPSMFASFTESFKDYPVSFNLSRNQFQRKFIDRLNLNFNLSAGAFSAGIMNGFIFTSTGTYDGHTVAYNGATGVTINFRGNGLSQRMYDFLIPLFIKKNIQLCVLEVLVNNKPAIEVYHRIGFTITRRLKCYRYNPARKVTSRNAKNVLIERVHTPDWERYTKFFDFLPSFIDSPQIIDNNRNYEHVFEATIGGVLAGYAICQPLLGRISHIAVGKDFRNKGIGSMLMRHTYKVCTNKDLTIINVPEETSGMHDFLLRSGFDNELDQFEMRMNIN